MTSSPAGPGHDGLALGALKRGEMLLALRNQSLSRAELMEALDISRTTIHRLVRALEAADLIEQRGDTFDLTLFGRIVTEEVYTYQRRISTASRLQPFIGTVETFPVDLGFFDDAVVTEAAPTNPYAPVERFVELLKGSATLRGFDTTSIAPISVEDVRAEILSGTDTDVIYLPAVVESILETFPEAVAAAMEAGGLTLSSHEALPFGLAIFDDRIGLGGYDEETGILRVFVDSADPQAREWAVDLYEQYRSEAEAIASPDSIHAD